MSGWLGPFCLSRITRITTAAIANIATPAPMPIKIPVLPPPDFLRVCGLRDLPIGTASGISAASYGSASGIPNSPSGAKGSFCWAGAGTVIFP